MYLKTNTTVKLANGNTRHAQEIGIILYNCTNYDGLYTMVPVDYCSGHPSNTISMSALNFYVGFKKVTSETLENYDFVNIERLFLDINPTD